MNERQKMKQKIVIKDSQNVNIIQAGRDVYYPQSGKDKELLPKEEEETTKK